MAECSHWKEGDRVRLWISLLFLGFGVGMAVVVGEEMGETAMMIAAGVMTGLIFGVIMALVGFRLGVRSGVDKMRLLQDLAPRAEPAPPNMYVLDPSRFAQPAPPPRGGLMNTGQVRTMPADMYQ